MQGARLVNKGGKNQQKQKQTNIRPGARNKLHSSRKKRNKRCLYFDTSLIQSFNVRSLKKGHIFFGFAYENLFSALTSRKGAELSTKTKEFNYYSVGIRAKQSGTVKNVQHSKNDYHERSKQVPKDWHSGDFDAKWQENELHKQTEML